MSALDVFTYADYEVRTVLIDGEPWFVLSDVCRVLGLTNPTMVAGRLPDALSQAYPIADRLGRTQQATIISEAGLYRVILRSDAPGAEPFMEWVTSDVLPTIRKTGRYGSDVEMLTALPSSQLLLLASEAAKRAEDAEAQVRELEGPAAAWNEIAAADGDYLVGDAAKMLSRAGIVIGQRRLFDWLDANRWTFLQGGVRHAMQTKVDAGLLVERPTDYVNPRTQEHVLGKPQIRVTPRGVEKLRDALTFMYRGVTA